MISREVRDASLLTPQRLHAELLATDPRFLDAYLQGALKDATSSELHGTHRYGQSEAEKNWLTSVS